MQPIKITGDHIDGWVDGTSRADVAWWITGHSQAERRCGMTTEHDVILLIRVIEADANRRIAWTALRTRAVTESELAEMPDGEVLHWTNWPGIASVPVTLARPDNGGNIRFANGRRLNADAAELTRVPRAGLEA